MTLSGVEQNGLDGFLSYFICGLSSGKDFDVLGSFFFSAHKSTFLPATELKVWLSVSELQVLNKLSEDQKF